MMGGWLVAVLYGISCKTINNCPSSATNLSTGVRKYCAYAYNNNWHAGGNIRDCRRAANHFIGW